MRMAELSRESGVSVASIKYYLREGLLEPGERTSPNQASYTDEHVRRLRLVRALLDVGDLSVTDVRAVLDQITRPDNRVHEMLGAAQKGWTAPPREVTEEEREWAMTRIGELATARGWLIEPESRVTDSLIAAICALRDVGRTEVLDRLERYAEIADQLAEVDISCVANLSTVESIVEVATVSTVLGDAVSAALRRIAQKNASAKQRYLPETQPPK